MQNLIFSLNATLPVFLVMVVGYALGQLGFLPPAFCKASDRLTFKVTLPLMLFLDMGQRGHLARLPAQVCAVLLCRHPRRHPDRLGGG